MQEAGQFKCSSSCAALYDQLCQAPDDICDYIKKNQCVSAQECIVRKDGVCSDCGADWFSDTTSCVHTCASDFYDARRVCVENVKEFPDDEDNVCQFMLTGSVWAYFNDLHCKLEKLDGHNISYGGGDLEFGGLINVIGTQLSMSAASVLTVLANDPGDQLKNTDFILNISIDSDGEHTFRCIGDPRSVTYSGQIKHQNSALSIDCDGYTYNINGDTDALSGVKQQECEVFDTAYMLPYDAKASNAYKNFVVLQCQDLANKYQLQNELQQLQQAAFSVYVYVSETKQIYLNV